MLLKAANVVLKDVPSKSSIVNQFKRKTKPIEVLLENSMGLMVHQLEQHHIIGPAWQFILV